MNFAYAMLANCTNRGVVSVMSPKCQTVSALKFFCFTPHTNGFLCFHFLFLSCCMPTILIFQNLRSKWKLWNACVCTCTCTNARAHARTCTQYFRISTKLMSSTPFWPWPVHFQASMKKLAWSCAAMLVFQPTARIISVLTLCGRQRHLIGKCLEYLSSNTEPECTGKLFCFTHRFVVEVRCSGRMQFSACVFVPWPWWVLLA